MGDETFLFTYGDGIGNFDIRGAIAFHRQHGHLATVSACSPPPRFGNLTIMGNKQVRAFLEKPSVETDKVSAGFFVLEPQVFDLISGDDTIWEQEPLLELASRGELFAWEHRGFWQPMDTSKDRDLLQALWNSGKAKWNLWEDSAAKPLRRAG